jgi:transcriptional regulator with XRE-family HTH domain
MSEPLGLEMRARMLGVLVRAARQNAHQSVAATAALLGLPPGDYEQYEYGHRSISLPELELLALHFDVPLHHFWGQEMLAARPPAPAVDDGVELLALRQRIVGAQLRAARTAAGLSPKELAAAAGLPHHRLSAYELGNKPIPLPELEELARALGLALDHFLPEVGPVAEWSAGRQQFLRFNELPPDVREFVAEPMNESYLRLAMQLASLSVERLRGVAEGILDITY